MEHTTRESWLQAAVDLMRPLITEKCGRDLAPVTVVCGWPSKSALARKSRRIGECWDGDNSADGKPFVFISPILDTADALATLAHELVHALVGCGCGHKGPFTKAMRQLGLVGKPTATSAGPDLKLFLANLATTLGDYPHAVLTPRMKEKKQGTRMIKCTCADCGYTCRTTRKWLEDTGAPICPCNQHAMQAEGMELEELDDDGQELVVLDHGRDLHNPVVPADPCPEHYGDGGPCDEGKPVASPHRVTNDDDSATPPCETCGEAASASRAGSWYCAEHFPRRKA